MRRREFIAGAATTAALSFAWSASAQTNARSPGVKRLAMFHPTEPPEGLTPSGRRAYKAYFGELNRLGYIEGQNLIVERYSALGQPDRIGELARQIVASRPDAILEISGPFIREVMATTTDIPMVGPTADPVLFGFTTSLARPDRNFTGVVVDAGVEIWGKRVELLLEATRKVAKLGFLDGNPTAITPGSRGYGRYISEAARRGGIAVAYVVIAGKFDRAAVERAGVYANVIVGDEQFDRTACEKTFDAMEKEGVDALILSDAPELLTTGS
jgi:ABC transporter substrate binding protein